MPHIIASKLGYFWQNTIFKKIILPFRENVKSPPLHSDELCRWNLLRTYTLHRTSLYMLSFLALFQKIQIFKFQFADFKRPLHLSPIRWLCRSFFIGYYSVGETIIGRPSLTLGDFAEEAKHLFENDPNFGSLLKNSLSFFVGDVGKPLAIGSIVCILLSTPIAYLAGYLLALLFAQRRTKTAAKKTINLLAKIFFLPNIAMYIDEICVESLHSGGTAVPLDMGRAYRTLFYARLRKRRTSFPNGTINWTALKSRWYPISMSARDRSKIGA